MYSPWDAEHDDFFDEGDGYSGAEEDDDEAAAPPPPSGRDARAEKDPSRVEELERENLRPADAQAREPRGEVGAAERPRDSVLGVDASSVTRVRRSSEPGGEERSPAGSTRADTKPNAAASRCISIYFNNSIYTNIIEIGQASQPRHY